MYIDRNVMFISLIGCLSYLGIILNWIGYILLPSGKVFNIYVDMIFGGALEVLSMILLYAVFNRLPRKILIKLFLGLQAIIILAAIISRSLSNGKYNYTANIRYNFIIIIHY